MLDGSRTRVYTHGLNTRMYLFASRALRFSSVRFVCEFVCLVETLDESSSAVRWMDVRRFGGCLVGNEKIGLFALK